jgi:predicted ATPase
VNDYRSKGKFDFWESYFLTLLAAAFLKHGAIEDGLKTVMDALKGGDQTGSQIWNAEFHRLWGELLLARDPADSSQAEASFDRALVIARSQNAKSWELRAALSLGRLWRRQGKRDEAAQLLNGIHEWFTEGFDTADLREAKILLDGLAVR